ncbi:MAG: DUF2163 domain-containing protein [Paracoccaceae bacterium]
MKTVSTALQAHLDSGVTTLCWCWRLERKDGTVMGFSDHDRPLTFDGITYEPSTGLSPAQISASDDLAVDAMETQGVLRSDRITETDILAGLWDNATAEVWRVNWADTNQRLLMRSASLGQIRRGKVAFVAEIRSLSHLLTQTTGRTYQYACDAELGDARCGVNLGDPAYNGAGVVGVVSRDRVFTATGLDGFATGLFAYGKVSWISGANAGLKHQVTGHSYDGATVTLSLLEAPVRAISAGDQFTVTAGCSKAVEDCVSFANILNFRAFPDIPPSDTVIRFAREDGSNSGETL